MLDLASSRNSKSWLVRISLFQGHTLHMSFKIFSKLRRPPTLSSLSLIITQLLFLRLVPNALGKSSVFKVTTNSTGMVDDSAAIVRANDNSLGLVMKRSRRWQIIRIWSRRFWSRRCPLPLSHLIFFYKGFCMRTIYSPTYVLTAYGLIVCLGCLLLDSFFPLFFLHRLSYSCHSHPPVYI